jgi:hypothetical protein
MQTCVITCPGCCRAPVQLRLATSHQTAAGWWGQPARPSAGRGEPQAPCAAPKRSAHRTQYIELLANEPTVQGMRGCKVVRTCCMLVAAIPTKLLSKLPCCCTCRFVPDPVPVATCVPPNETYPLARWEVDPTGVCRDSKLSQLHDMQQHCHVEFLDT